MRRSERGYDPRTPPHRRRGGRLGRNPTPADQSKPVGKAGHVRLGVDVPPEVKAALIELADFKRVTVSDVHREALLTYINGHGLIRRWPRAAA